MIEKAGAMNELDEILTIPGLDLVQFGPYDYAMSVGQPGQATSEEIRAVELTMISHALAAGVAVRAEIRSPEEVEYYRELSVRHSSIGVDSSSCTSGGERTASRCASAYRRAEVARARGPVPHASRVQTPAAS